MRASARHSMANPAKMRNVVIEVCRVLRYLPTVLCLFSSFAHAKPQLEHESGVAPSRDHAYEQGDNAPTLPPPANEVIPDSFKSYSDRSDDAPSIQRAITSLCTANGGRIIFKARHYNLQTSIKQSCPVLWEGQGWQEYPSDVPHAYGTWFDIRGQGFTPITLSGAGSQGSEFRDIAFAQPDQKFPVESSRWVPDVYPWAIDIVGVNGYVGFSHVFMDGIYDGIRQLNGQRLTVSGLFGQWLHIGVFMDGIYDVDRIADFHDWPYWSQAKAVLSFQETNHTGLMLGRVDSPFLQGLFVYAANAAVNLIHGRTGIATGVSITGLSCDSVRHCLQIDTEGSTVQIGNMREFGMDATENTPLVGSAAMYISGTALVQIGNLEVSYLDKTVIDAENQNSCSKIQISNAIFNFANFSSPNVNVLAAIRCSDNGKTEVSIGSKPIILLPRSKGFSASSSLYGAVFWPQERERD